MTCAERFITRKNKPLHLRSKKHQEALKNLNNINNVSLQNNDLREDGKAEARQEV